MLTQSSYQNVLACFESFQFIISTFSISVDFNLEFYGLVFNQCHIFMGPGYPDIIDIIMFPLTGPSHR